MQSFLNSLTAIAGQGDATQNLLMLIGLALAAMTAAALALWLLMGVVLPLAAALSARLAARLGRKPSPGRLRRTAIALLDPTDAEHGAVPVLLIGLGIAALLAGFVSLAEDVVEAMSATGNSALTVFDTTINAAMTGLRTPVGDSAMIFLTSFGDWPVPTAVTLAMVFWLFAQQEWRLGLGFGVVMALSSVLVSLLKVGFAVPRPNAFYEGVQSFSFPSGHATSSMTLFGLLAWFAWRGLGWPLNRLLPAVFAAIAALIALSRLYLGAHWPSDVAGGLMLGAALVLAFALAFRRVGAGRLAAAKGLTLALTVFLGFGTAYAIYNAPKAEARYTLPDNS